MANVTVADPKRQEEIARSYYDDTPGNAETERLLVKIDNLRKGKPNQSLLITSAVLGEGKSTVASQIAMASSRNRRTPTLLVDFDLRRPRIHEIFGLKKEFGVAEILTNQLPLKVCIKDTFVDNLKILTSGSLENSPLQVFNTENVRRFFDKAHEHFDFIVVDSPPVVPVSDPLTLAKITDHVVFVLKAGHTPKKVIKRAVEMMTSVEVKISGLIINNMDNVFPTQFDYKYYGYHYYSYSDTKQNGRNTRR